MIRTLKQLARLALIDTPFWDRRQTHKGVAAVRQWAASGKFGPPPHLVKEQTVAHYARHFQTRNLIETGTYVGDMVSAMRHRFNRIVSIELSPELAALGQKRFHRFGHIRILEGDSAKLLPGVLATTHEPCLFWLDGHYSGHGTARGDYDTPIVTELRIISDHAVKQHVILIDDARLFNGTDEYPRLEELQDLLAIYFPNHKFSLEDDIIRILPEP